ncbi:hypothetical protein IPL68_06950 [Candidatus Saccharibacteria bacterium]|nr:MAG: hypothetical protein IPL68_06950 [Candidatus Saccharibacteria bacterium]
MAEAKHIIEHSKIPDMTPEEVFVIVDEMAKEIGSQMAKYQFEVLNKTIEETGNSVDAKGQKLSPELFLETISMMSISFDKDGNPKLPTIVISPKTADQWKRVMSGSGSRPRTQEKNLMRL